MAGLKPEPFARSTGGKEGRFWSPKPVWMRFGQRAGPSSAATFGVCSLAEGLTPQEKLEKPARATT
jgi:hypothetical protein